MDAHSEFLSTEVGESEQFPPAKCSGHLAIRPGQVVDDLRHGPAMVVVEDGSVTIEQNGQRRYASGWSLVVLYGQSPIKMSSTNGASLTWIIFKPASVLDGFGEESYTCDLTVFSDMALLSGGVAEVTTVLGHDLGVRVAQVDIVSVWRPLSATPKHRFIGAAENDTSLVTELVYRPSVPLPSEIFSSCLDLAVIGAGPTGMSIAAHAESHGLKYAIFGEPWAFWHRHMIPLPLRSPPTTTNIDTPRGGFQFMDFARQFKRPETKRISFAEFIAYASWFADQHRLRPVRLAVQALRRVQGIWLMQTPKGIIRARHVVVAVGLSGMQRLPENAVGHPRFSTAVSDIKYFGEFRDKRVAVIGAGQSAAEAALSLAAAGAKVHLVVRGPRVIFRSLHSPGGLIFKVLFNRANQFIPFLPARAKTLVLRYLTKGTIEPRLKDELSRCNVEIHTCSRVVPNVGGGQRPLEIHSPHEEPLTVDHAIMGTGYAFDVRRIPFLRDVPVAHVQGLPRLNRYGESSVPGLYFCGIAALRLIGPQVQFVFGTRKLSPRIMAGILRFRSRGGGGHNRHGHSEAAAVGRGTG